MVTFFLIMALSGFIGVVACLAHGAATRRRPARVATIAPLPRRFDWEAFDRERRVESGEWP